MIFVLMRDAEHYDHGVWGEGKRGGGGKGGGRKEEGGGKLVRGHAVQHVGAYHSTSSLLWSLGLG